MPLSALTIYICYAYAYIIATSSFDVILSEEQEQITCRREAGSHTSTCYEGRNRCRSSVTFPPLESDHTACYSSHSNTANSVRSVPREGSRISYCDSDPTTSGCLGTPPCSDQTPAGSWKRPQSGPTCWSRTAWRRPLLACSGTNRWW